MMIYELVESSKSPDKTWIVKRIPKVGNYVQTLLRQTLRWRMLLDAARAHEERYFINCILLQEIWAKFRLPKREPNKVISLIFSCGQFQRFVSARFCNVFVFANKLQKASFKKMLFLIFCATVVRCFCFFFRSQCLPRLNERNKTCFLPPLLTQFRRQTKKIIQKYVMKCWRNRDTKRERETWRLSRAFMSDIFMR